MEWETGHLINTTSAPLHSSIEIQHWMYLEDRFLSFEKSLSDFTFPKEHSELGECTSFNYIDDDLFSLYDVVDMFPPLPPLETPDDNIHQQSNNDVVSPLSLTPLEVCYDQRNGTHNDVVNADDNTKPDAMVVLPDPPVPQIRARSWARTKSQVLTFGDVQKYFDMPILEASKELQVGLTLLKKRCRELGIRRWPHRKLRSLKYLINNVKELGLDEEVTMLEEQGMILVNQPEMELNDRAKKIRQRSFKANHMRRRKMKAAVCVQTQTLEGSSS